MSISRFTDISYWISDAAMRAPAKTAIRFEGRELSYREFEQQVGALAGILRSSGVSTGDRVSFLGPNCPELLEALFACARLGAIFVPLNARMPAAELAVFTELSRPAAMLVEANLAQTAGECVGLQRVPILVFSIGQRWDCKPVATGSPAGVSSPVLIAFTSGTTGTPKGAVLTHEALIANAAGTADALDLTATDKVLTVTPMFHIAGLNLLTIPALSIGATVIVHRQFHPAAVLAELATGTVSLLVSPPHLTFEVAANPAWEYTDVSGLRCVMTGGTTVPTRAVDRWTSRGVTVIQGYGQTEAGGNVTLVRPPEAPGQSTCAGRPMPGWDVRIISPGAAHTAGPGGRGEIAVRGPSVMRQYWHNPQATAEVLRDGWLRTGDLGFVDAGGYLHVTGRIKDVIVVGTSNVVPGDLEAVLADSPEIAAAAVVGRPDDKLGEVPVAFVVPTPGRQMSAEQVMAMFNGRVAPYKHPRNVIFLDAMPRTSVGKPAKNTLRALAALADNPEPGLPSRAPSTKKAPVIADAAG